MTSRNPECKIHQTVGWEEVVSLSTEDSIELLFKTAQIPEDSRLSETDSALKVVEAIGHHTLAIRSAGALIARGYVTIAGYPSFHEKQKDRVLNSGLGQEKSRYFNVFATLEASIKMLEPSDVKQSRVEESYVEESRDALRLFQVLSWVHHNKISLDFLECAWTEAEKNEPAHDRIPRQVLKDEADLWADRFRLVSAVNRLESVALLRKDVGDKGSSLTVSIHPLGQDWSRFRLHKNGQTARSLLLASSAAILATVSIGRLDVNHWSSWMFRFGVHLGVLHHEHSNKLELENHSETVLMRVRVRQAPISWVEAMMKQVSVNQKRIEEHVADQGKYMQELDAMRQYLDEASMLENPDAARCRNQLKKAHQEAKDLASRNIQLAEYLAEATSALTRGAEKSQRSQRRISVRGNVEQ